MEGFTPVSGLVGGLLIGISTAMLMLLNGRVAGISGIVGGLLSRKGGGELGWRVLFALGLPLGGLLYALLSGGMFPVRVETSLPVMIIAGLLVGFGARLGSGCTSGHGVSGLARLSRRSVAATAFFFGTALLTVYVVRHVL